MKFITEIPFIKPPEKSIKLINSIRIRSIKLGDLWEDDGSTINVLNKKDLLGTMYAFEIGGYFRLHWFNTIKKKKKNDIELKDRKTTILEFDIKDEEIAEAVFYLLIIHTGHWKYILSRTEHLKKPLRIHGEIKYPKPTLYSITKIRLKKIKKYTSSIKSYKRFNIASHLWFLSLHRNNPLDILRDCISACEGLLETNGKLNLSFSFLNYTGDIKDFHFMYLMNSYRDSYVHGNKIPVIKKEDIERLVLCSYNCLKKYSEGCKVFGMNDLVRNFRI